MLGEQLGQLQQGPAAAGRVAQIAKLASLHDAGILTDEEFAKKKAELLERL
ncbi:SHOCT domain-containing protein [Actinoplanes sp. NPDC051513]|uniref:SHOCT domain-containing protein n=1 Tax=Actinoplanes sp. NPDC051513 TaxID=3363908 RepID=UPI0037901FE9